MKHLPFVVALLLGVSTLVLNAQSIFKKTDNWFAPADSLNTTRRNIVVTSHGLLGGGTLYLLGQTWYSKHQQNDFHLYNDNTEWLQMDKMGHVFSTYTLTKHTANMYKWAGIDHNSSAIYGSIVGFTFVSAIEILDGYSEQWGFSYGDMLANLGGSAFYLGQELLWNEQRIQFKYSFHTTPYANRRPELLGATLSEQMLKDYNGQTYWISANLHSFFQSKYIPKWLNISLGYGAEGMLTGHQALVNYIFLPEKQRFRQFYLSFDVDLERIETKSHLLKTIFSIINTIKIPAPTLEYNTKGKFIFRPLYF